MSLKLSELPQSQPQITGGDILKNYKVGDLLNLTCTSAPSNPPAKLEWILNDQPVSTVFKIIRAELVLFLAHCAMCILS